LMLVIDNRHTTIITAGLYTQSLNQQLSS